MRILGLWLALLLIVVVALIPTVYTLRRAADSQFRDDFMSNWFATMIGVIVGIPIALELDRRQREAQERREQKARKQEELARKAKILELLKGELGYNREALLGRQVARGQETERVVLVDRLKDELWNAFSDGGELQWIRDLDLLDAVSTAYYHVRMTIYLEERYFEATHFPGLQIEQRKYAKDYIMDYLRESDTEVLRQVDQALQRIEISLTSVRDVIGG